MRARLFLLPIAALVLAGCDRITGGVDQKALDAEAIGYACRVSLKPPEDCMLDNDTHSPTSILYGWKEADRDIREKLIDPSMGKRPPAPQAPQAAPPVATPAATAENKPATESGAATKSEKPAAAKPAGR